MESSSVTTLHAPVITGLKRKEVVLEWTIQNFEDVLLKPAKPVVQVFTYNCGNDGDQPWGTWGFYLKMGQVDGETWIGICYEPHRNKDAHELKEISSRLQAQVMQKDKTADPRWTVTFGYKNINALKKYHCWEWTRFLKRSATVGRTGILIDGNLVLQLKLELFRPPSVTPEPALSALASVMQAQQANEIQKLSPDLKTVFDTSLFTDSVIITEDGESYNVHKAILSCRSSVFAATFGQNFVEKQSGEVRVTDVDGPTMKLMLEYIYSGKISNGHSLQPRELLNLAYAAEKYNLIFLHSYCDRGLARKANIFWNMTDAQEQVLTVERLRLRKAEGAIREYAKHSFQHLEGTIDELVTASEVSIRLPSLIKVTTGVEKQTYCFEWIIRNCECMLKNDEIFNTQKKTVEFGQVLNRSLTWTFYMAAYEEAGEKWMSLFWNVEKDGDIGSLYCRIQVEMMTRDKTAFRTIVSDVVDVKEKSNIGWDKVINRRDIGNTATFVDGSLFLQMKVDLLRDIPPRYEEQRSEEDYERLEGVKLCMDLDNLYKNMDFSDITIVAKDGVECKAHKAILAGRSSGLVARLPQEEQSTIRLNDMNGHTLKGILRYIYTGRILVQDACLASWIVELADAAKMYGLEGLLELCDQLLSQTHDMSNATQLFVAAKKLCLKKSEKVIGNYLKQHWEQLDLNSVAVIMGSVTKRQVCSDTCETSKRKK